jgi:hypothetical protein
MAEWRLMMPRIEIVPQVLYFQRLRADTIPFSIQDGKAGIADLHESGAALQQ